MDVFEREMDIPVKWIGNPNFEIMLSMHEAKKWKFQVGIIHFITFIIGLVARFEWQTKMMKMKFSKFII